MARTRGTVGSGLSPARYVALLHRARQQLTEARIMLAGATRPSARPCYVQERWQWAERLMRARQPALLQYPHVVGVGLGTKVTGGIDTDVVCVTVFVTRKLTRRTLDRRGARRLPRVLRDGRRTLPVDVVRLGVIVRQAFPGSSCSIAGGFTRVGTIGAPAVVPGGAGVFITAMHVTGVSEITPGSGVTLPVRAPSIGEAPGAPVIGNVVQGTRTGIDAAKVLLDSPHQVSRTLPGIGSIRGWRPMAFPADRHIPVALFGGGSKRVHHGAIEHPAIDLPADRLQSAITVTGMGTIDGDSGAALVDRERLVLGFLVGAASNGARVFCPASLVLRTLRCDIPMGHE
jgi:hypothetical protein